MEKDDKGSTLIRIGVSGWKFLLVPAYPGCPGSKAVKRSLLVLFELLGCYDIESGGQKNESDGTFSIYLSSVDINGLQLDSSST